MFFLLLVNVECLDVVGSSFKWQVDESKYLYQHKPLSCQPLEKKGALLRGWLLIVGAGAIKGYITKPCRDAFFNHNFNIKLIGSRTYLVLDFLFFFCGTEESALSDSFLYLKLLKKKHCLMFRKPLLAQVHKSKCSFLYNFCFILGKKCWGKKNAPY